MSGVLALLVLHALHAVGASPGGWYEDAVARWFLVAVFLACGAACLSRSRSAGAERGPWALVGSGLVVYGLGSVVYNVELARDPALAFPSIADALWLSFYPLSLAG